MKKVHEDSLPRTGCGRVCLDFVICTSHGPYEELRGVVNDTFVSDLNLKIRELQLPLPSQG